MKPYYGSYVYRLYDAGRTLLYVGCTSDPEGRRKGHKSTKTWWSDVASWRLVGPFLGPDAALRYERKTIRDECPVHNVAWQAHGNLRLVSEPHRAGLSALVAQNVRAELARQGLRQHRLAAALDLSVQTVSRRLNQGDFTLVELERIAQLVQVDAYDLFQDVSATTAASA